MTSLFTLTLGGICVGWFTGQWRAVILFSIITALVRSRSTKFWGLRAARVWKACKTWKAENAPWILNFDPEDPWEVYREVPIRDGSRKVRLLEVLPGQWLEPIKCNLRSFDGTKPPPFDALSYSWTQSFPGLDNNRSFEGLWQRIKSVLLQSLSSLGLQGFSQRQNSTDFCMFEVPAFLSMQLLRILRKLGVKTWIKLWGRAVGNPSKRLIYVSVPKTDRTTGKRRYLSIEVSYNLEMALRHLRDKTKPVKLWADAVCINQDDDNDRNNQVQGMREMYVKASSVEIWLGYARDITTKDISGGLRASFRDRFAPIIPVDPWSRSGRNQQPQNGMDLTWRYRDEDNFDSKTPANVKIQQEYQLLKDIKAKWRQYHSLAISRRAHMELQPTEQCLCMIHQLAYHAFKKCKDGRNPRPLDERIVFLLKDAARSAVFTVFEHLINASWWSRIWVVQETVIAEQVFVRYGGYRMEWALLVRAARNLEKHRQLNCCASDFEKLPPRHLEMFTKFAEQVLSLETWRYAWRKKDKSKIKLLTLIWRFRHRKTSNPRDKVYALYSLVTNFGNVTEEQDKLRALNLRYQSSVAAVYRHTFTSIVKMEGNLNILIGNSRKSAGLVDQLPTWIPDWYEQPLFGEFDRLQRAELYSAFGKGKMDSDYRSLEGSHDENVLRVRGIILDCVKTVGDKMPEHTDEAVAEAQDVHCQWRRLAGLEGAEEGSDNYPHLSFTIHKSEGQPEEEQLTKINAYGRVLCMDTKKSNTQWDEDMEDYVNPYYRVNKTYDNAMQAHCGLGRGDNGPPSEMQRAYTWARKQQTEALAPFVAQQNGTAAKAAPIHDGQASQPEQTEELAISRKTGSMQHDFALQVNESEKSAITGRCFFMTKNGYMGLGPDNIQIGDIVAIVFGCAMPLILHPIEPQQVADDPNEISQHQPHQTVDQTNLEPEQQSVAGEEVNPNTLQSVRVEQETTDRGKLFAPNSDSQDMSNPVLPELTACYELVGDAYVQGAMYGEAVRDPEEPGMFLHLV